MTRAHKFICNPHIHIIYAQFLQTKNPPGHSSIESSIDQGPYLNVNHGMVAAMGPELTPDGAVEESSEDQKNTRKSTNGVPSDSEKPDLLIKSTKPDCEENTPQSSNEAAKINGVNSPDENIIRRCLDQLSRQNRRSMWVLAYISLLSSWPLLGAALQFFFKKRTKKVLPPNLNS